MRDEKRIDRILKLIGDKWKNNPDQRFGQFLINIGCAPDDIALWRLEDNDLEEGLKEMSAENKGK